LGLLLIIVFSIALNRTGISNVRSVFALKEGRIQNSSFILRQGEEKKEYPDLFFVQDNSLSAVSPAVAVSSQVLGAFAEGIEHNSGDDIQEYMVQENDTLSSIAQKFDISLETILWANDLTRKSVIQPGQKLIILPVTGVMHLVRDGDTISQIAQTYNGKQDEIIAFNHLSNSGDIFVGDMIIIPNGEMPIVKPSVPTIPLANSYFILPLASPCRITQGLHWYNAIDFSNGVCGEPIFAVAGGKVQRTGYKKFYGYYVQLLHPNGVSTLYAHLSKIIVNPGQKVYQGQVIGYTGYSGHTIPAGPAGCHLHFEVRGARNPFAR